jgi:hypothetical protein
MASTKASEEKVPLISTAELAHIFREDKAIQTVVFAFHIPHHPRTTSPPTHHITTHAPHHHPRITTPPTHHHTTHAPTPRTAPPHHAPRGCTGCGNGCVRGRVRMRVLWCVRGDVSRVLKIKILHKHNTTRTRHAHHTVNHARTTPCTRAPHRAPAHATHAPRTHHACDRSHDEEK